MSLSEIPPSEAAVADSGSVMELDERIRRLRQRVDGIQRALADPAFGAATPSDSLVIVPPPVATPVRKTARASAGGASDPRILAIRRILMQQGTWRYLRYIHLRQYVALVADSIESVCVCGAGHGWAELALAVEFPHIEFTLTDIIADGYPNYHKAMDFAWVESVGNVRFSIWNVLKPAPRTYDLVCSTEMLEHIEDAELAVRNMRAAAGQYVYCLVPFADRNSNDNPKRRKSVLERFGHFVCGYDSSDMERLFPNPVALGGAYWADAGVLLRQRLTALSQKDILAQFDKLAADADADLREGVPVNSEDAQAIRILSRA